MSDGAKMTGERSYSDLSDSATTFDPEEQFDRDIDERMKGMDDSNKISPTATWDKLNAFDAENGVEPFRSVAERIAGKYELSSAHKLVDDISNALEDAYHLGEKRGPIVAQAISMSQFYPGLDSAIQDELDHPPASIMEEGK
jgi:hypothetical protein